MKRIFFILIILTFFVGCMSDREKFEKEFAAGCVSGYPIQNREVEKVCECLAKLISSKFTDKELAITNKKYVTNQERINITSKRSRIEQQLQSNQKEIESYIAKCMKKQ